MFLLQVVFILSEEKIMHTLWILLNLTSKLFFQKFEILAVAKFYLKNNLLAGPDIYNGCSV